MLKKQINKLKKRAMPLSIMLFSSASLNTEVNSS